MRDASATKTYVFPPKETKYLPPFAPLSLSVTDPTSCKVIAAWAPDLTSFNVAQVFTDAISCKLT
jgi:hypothetical protein